MVAQAFEVRWQIDSFIPLLIYGKNQVLKWPLVAI
jgi:hypothetical protein